MTKKALFPVIARLNVPINFIVILAVVIALLVPAAGYVVSAQQADHPWWRVRTLEMEEYGLSKLEGMAFSPEANAFLLAQEDGSLAGVGMREEPVDATGLQLPAGNARTMAYNGYTDRLFVLSSDNSELAEISMDASGLPAPTIARAHRLDAVNLQAARGITFDEASGKMFVLHADGDQMVIITPDANGSYDPAPGRVSRVSLRSLGAVDLRSIAFNPQTGNIYLLDAYDQRLYEITVSGSKVNEFDLRELGMGDPITMLFAPSVDRTDDPDNYNLSILYKSAAISADRMVELSLSAPAALPGGTPIFPATLIRVQNLNNTVWNPSSPDTSGIDYWPAKGRFLLVDSEVEEMAPYWQGYNVFSGTTTGVQGPSCTTYTPSGGTPWNNYTPEPTGLAINPETNRIYIASDSGAKFFEINIGQDNEYCTSDDVVSTNTISGIDLEDVAYGDNQLFIAAGVDAEIYWFDLGPNKIVGGGDDGPMQHFDTARWGFSDMEGIGYHSDHHTILISGSHGGDQAYIAEVSTENGGTLLRAYNVEPFMTDDNDLHSDITYAPSSVNPDIKVVYIVSRGVDNGANPNENDGRWWEINIGDIPISTPTTGPTATRTSTATATATATATGTIATPTFTATATATATTTATNTATATATATRTATATGVPTDPTQAIFSDVPAGHWAKFYIETLYQSGVTGGCATGPLRYCPANVVTRDQMAVFLLKAKHGSNYTPPAVGASTGFADVPTTHWAAAWIKQLAAEGITGGCGNGNYCPGDTVTRDQMAVFLLKSKYGKSYTPPPAGSSTGFTDVPPSHWAAAWIKRLVAEGITGGCGTGLFCPGQAVTRDQMAVFLVKTFNLP